MACKYYINGEWVSEEKLKEVLNNGLLDSLIAEKTIELENFPLDHNKVTSPEYVENKSYSIPITKLRDILVKEVRTRQGYPDNMIEALELNEKGTDFKIPLWASSYAEKFESLLNSIVSKKVIKQKFPGHSYVLASEEGFRMKTGDAALEEIAKTSGIVFTKNFDPKEGLQPMRYDEETGKMRPAQIMVPFRFRDENGEILDITEFIDPETNLLDTTKIPEKILRLSGYRIPTLKQNYMRMVEIVGFLPEASGDMLLAPRDFTVSMGSDFDVDKLYTYMYNTYYQDGKLHTDFLSDKNKIQSETDKTLLIIKEIEDNLKLSKEQKSLLRAARRSEEPLISFMADISDDLTDIARKDLQEQYRKLGVLKRSYRASRQNEILDIQAKILLSDNRDVVKSLIKRDGTGDFDSLAKEITQIRLDQGILMPTVSYLSDTYQRKKFVNATAGKDGVGAFSLDSTFNAVVQGQDLIFLNLSKENRKIAFGNKGEKAPTHAQLLRLNDPLVTFGEHVSYGDISNKYTLRSQKIIENAKGRELTKEEKESLEYKSNIISWLQSAAVDNEKEQLLDKLNINDETFSAIRAMISLGFEPTDITGLLTSEIIWEYISEVKALRSELQGYISNVEQKAYEKLLKKYDTQNKLSKLKINGNLSLIDKNSSGEELINDTASEKLIPTDENTTTSDFNLKQLLLIEKFQKLTELGGQIKEIQSSINSESNGVPKNFIEGYQKVQQINRLPNSNIFNASNLLGNYEQIAPGIQILSEPTTINGHAAYYGTMFADQIFSRYFPYKRSGVRKINSEISLHTGRNIRGMSMQKKAELQRNIFRNMRSFVFASPDTGLFTETAHKEFKRLFLDDRKKGHDSLATILQKLSNDPKYASWYSKNNFLSRLLPNANTNGKISRIDFEAATAENYDESNIYIGFINLIKKNAPIGTYNGIEYTTRMLARELIAAAFLEGGNQGAKQYLKYVPMPYLKSIGFGEYLNDINFSYTSTFKGLSKEEREEEVAFKDKEENPEFYYPAEFTRQYFQNNPSEAKAIHLVELEGNHKIAPKDSFTIKEGFISAYSIEGVIPNKFAPLNFLSIYDPKSPGKYALYEYNTETNRYERLSSLKQSYGTTQYDAKSTPVSLEDHAKSTSKKETKSPEKPGPNVGTVKTPTGPSATVITTTPKQSVELLPLKKQFNNTHEGLRDLVSTMILHEETPAYEKLLLSRLNEIGIFSEIKLNIVKDKEGGAGVFNSVDNVLTLNVAQLTTMDKLAETLAHELIHGFTSESIKDYFTDKGSLTLEQIEAVEKLDNLRSKYIKALVEKEGNKGLGNFHLKYLDWKLSRGKITQEFYDKKVAELKTKIGNYERDESLPLSIANVEDQSKYYGAIKLEEFVTMALTDAGFQQHLNSIIDEDAEISLWEQFKKLLEDLLRAIGLDIEPNSLLASALRESMSLIEINGELKNPIDEKLDTHEFLYHGAKYIFKVKSDGTVVSGQYAQENGEGILRDLNPKGMQRKFEQILKVKEKEKLKQSKPSGSSSTTQQPSPTIEPTVNNEGKINIYAGTGENSHLSNFAKRPFIHPDLTAGETFNTVEGAFQAAKLGYTVEYFNEEGLLNKEGHQILDKLKNATGKDAKAIGRKIKGLDTKTWDSISSEIMETLLLESFAQNSEAAANLIATGNTELTHTQDKGKWGKEFPKLLMKIREELTPVEQTNSIVFNDGTEIDTGDIVLNTDQREALLAMGDFVMQGFAEDNQSFALKGYAGTGKTTILEILKKYLKKKAPFKPVQFSSPTHRANEVMRVKGVGDVKTLHALFGLRPNLELEKFDANSVKFAKKADSKLESRGLLIIDEASMMNDALYKFVKESSANLGTQIIVVGDPAQLKPVKQKTLSKSFSEVDGLSELTIVERTGDNPLLAESMEVRNTTSGEPFTKISAVNEKGEGIVFTDSKEQFLQEAFELFTSEKFKENPLLVRLLASSNKTVQKMNTDLRKGLWGDESDNEFNVGEILMGYSNWGTDYKTKIPKIANGGDYIITAITPETKQIVPGMEHQGYRVTIENLIDKKAKPVHTFILSENNSMEKLKAIGDEYERLRQEAMSLPKGSQAARQAWIALSNFGESFIAKFDVTDSKGYTKVSRGIDYGYAHTIHKSQGGTYKYIFVNDKDIESTFSKDKDIRQQSKYVGITRAETKAVVLTNFDKNQSYEEEVSKEVYENSPTKTLNDLFADESRKAKDEYTTDDYDTWALYAKERQQDEDEMLEDQEFRKAYEEYLIMCKKK